MSTRDNHYYEVAPSGSLSHRLLKFARDRMFEDFVRVSKPLPSETILDVGVSDVIEEGSNFLERLYPFQEKITAAGLGTAEDFRAAFPAVTYKQIVAGQRLPFADCHFDIATSNAVLEHAGSQQGQQQLFAELVRVSKRVFITVPNRFFPVEHHTALPLVHWSDPIFSFACRLTGRAKWALPENLILMSRSRLAAICPSGLSYTLGESGLPLGPCSSNLWIYIEKDRVDVT